MEFIFITALHNFSIIEGLHNGDKIGDGIKITNDSNVKSTFVNESLKPMIGAIEYNHLKTTEVFLYSSEKVSSEADPIAYLTSKMYTVQDFLMASWLKSDNSINFELCFLVSKGARNYNVTSNFLSHKYHSADGSDISVRLSRKKLQEIRKIHVERLGIKSSQAPVADAQFSRDNSRLGRALTWMNMARGNFDFSIRVANFCTALETLFSTSNSEIAHQLSERVAIFLEDNPEGRLVVFKKIKKAYDLRSKTIHGSTTTQTPSKNPKDISVDIEEISKRVVFKIIENDKIFEDFNKPDDQLGIILLSMIISGRTPVDRFVSI
ncbi:hypothetical protein U0O11_01965 [Cobetia sp. D5]|uniref:hypothetical protein n=1 Tax=Cobetia sp. D5 TaxID=3105867 RepID=UPI002D77EFF8|nr:hypothetical protein [Cobetia sp. D5]